MLAHRMLETGHDVAVIDQDPQSLRRLGDDFPGRCVVGVGFDRETLERAGIRWAAGFAAVSSGDNSNIIAARVVREEFGVRNVVARIYDPRRAEVYERLGVATVATVRWTAGQVLGRLIPGSADRDFQDVSGALTMVSAVPDADWVSLPLRTVEEATGARLAFVTRLGEGTLPKPGMRVQQGDRLHLMVPTDQLSEVESVLAHPRPSADAPGKEQR
jgi:trk system potassium uptake protein TrkA